MLAAGTLVFVVAAGLALVAGIAAATTRHLARGRGDHEILASIGASRRTVIGLATVETMPAALLAGIFVGTVPLLLARFTPFGSSARGIDPTRARLRGCSCSSRRARLWQRSLPPWQPRQQS